MRILAIILSALVVLMGASMALPASGANTGSITIIVDIVDTIPDAPNAEDAVFVFDSPFGPFELEAHESRRFTGLASDIYTITERSMNGWLLPNVICSDGSNRSGHSAYVELAPGEHVTCRFINESAGTVPTGTPVPTGQSAFISPPSTGSAGLASK